MVAIVDWARGGTHQVEKQRLRDGARCEICDVVDNDGAIRIVAISVKPSAAPGQARNSSQAASLAQTLSVMRACVVLDASITIPLGGRTADPDGMVADAADATEPRSVIHVLVCHARDAEAF
jgi:hypothetical protein